MIYYKGLLNKIFGVVLIWVASIAKETLNQSIELCKEALSLNFNDRDAWCKHALFISGD